MRHMRIQRSILASARRLPISSAPGTIPPCHAAKLAWLLAGTTCCPLSFTGWKRAFPVVGRGAALFLISLHPAPIPVIVIPRGSHCPLPKFEPRCMGQRDKRGTVHSHPIKGDIFPPYIAGVPLSLPRLIYLFRIDSMNDYQDPPSFY